MVETNLQLEARVPRRARKGLARSHRRIVRFGDKRALGGILVAYEQARPVDPNPDLYLSFVDGSTVFARPTYLRPPSQANDPRWLDHQHFD